MPEDKNIADQVIAKLDQALAALKAFGQGRVFDVGVLVKYQGKLGIVVDLNKDATDPAGSTIDIRLEDGKVIEKVKVSSKSLEFYRA